MNYRRLLILLLVLFFTSEERCAADEKQVRSQIQQYSQQLGDDSFLVRERAESQLTQIGIQAFQDLQRAKQSNDIEVARRAEYILSRIEQSLLATENQEAAFWFHYYMQATQLAFKARIIWELADPTSDLSQGEGLPTLCRFVRFEENAALRLESAKSLIASPPLIPSLRKHWYRYIRDNIHETDEDTLLQCLARYATLWCELDDTEQRTTAEFQDRARQVGTETLQLLERPENSIQIGSKIDILLHYAVIELYDAAGLSEERDKALTKVRAIIPEAIRPTEQVESIMSLVDDNLFMSGHFFAGYCLMKRYRLHWALAHFQKVMESGELTLRVKGSEHAAEIAIYLNDYASAAAFFGKTIEFLDNPEYKEKFSNAPRGIAAAKKRQLYCLAEQAAAAGDWDKAEQLLTESWAVPDVQGDIADTEQVILAHRLIKQKTDVGLEFKNSVQMHEAQVWEAIENDYRRSSLDQRVTALTIMCNSAAWLLANTEGNYENAMTFAEIARKAVPEDAEILDTAAHVYFLGGKLEDAVRIQEQVVRMAPEAVVFRKSLERFRQGK